MDFSARRRSILDLLGDNGTIISSRSVLLFATLACLLAPPLYYIYRYRRSIKDRLDAIEKNVSLVKVVRNVDKKEDVVVGVGKEKKKNRVICMELDPEFVAANPDCKMMSLGTYLSQLEPAQDSGFNRMFLQKELETTIGAFLLKTLGRTYGAAVLPVLGAGSVAGAIAGISGKLSKFVARSILPKDDDGEAAGAAATATDPLSLDISLMELVAFINVHSTVTSEPDPTRLAPLDYLGRGEKAAGDLSYDLGDGQFPAVFDLMEDFGKYVEKMEDRIRQKEGRYDPYDRSVPPSTPINERLLPGLSLGNGDLKYTHTKKEGIEHRLMCVLLNKLSHNYHKLAEQGKLEDCFKVLCNGKTFHFPEELIQGLVDCGHRVEVCPRVMVTNFGLSLCVKEEDGSFSYIPTAIVIRTGIESTFDNRQAYMAAPHGGMDLNISGPLIGNNNGGNDRPAWIQFYVSIGGLTCFHPDEDVDAPWRAKTSLANVYSHDDAIRAIRMCAVVAIVFSKIATDFNLSFGGYGVLGMCNDSSTIIDFALRGRTNAYPLLSTGRYLNHTVMYLIKLKDELSRNTAASSRLRPVIDDLMRLIRSTSQLPSDLHISPKTLIGEEGTSSRFDKSYGFPIFQSTTDAKSILREMADISRDYLE